MNVTQFVVMLCPRAAQQTSSVGGKRWRLEKDMIVRAKPFQKAAMLGALRKMVIAFDQSNEAER